MTSAGRNLAPLPLTFVTPIKGTFTMKMGASEEATPMTVNATVTGKWLGASCGDVK